jgi:hypothetical protein
MGLTNINVLDWGKPLSTKRVKKIRNQVMETKDVLQKLIDAHPKFFHGKNPTCSSYLLEGWYDIVDQGITKIEELLSEKELEEIEVGQIKEKFGYLRIYARVPEHALSVLDEMEEQSSKTCEVCGAEGKLLTKGWMSVRCDKHAKSTS